MEYNLDATRIDMTYGTVRHIGYLSSSVGGVTESSRRMVQLGANISGTSDIVIIAAQSLKGNGG